MSIQAVSWVLDYSDAAGLDRLVLIAIANHFNNEDREARPSIRRIAQEARCSTNTVMAAIRRLTELGEVDVIDPGGYRVCARYSMPLVPEPKPVDKRVGECLNSETQRRDKRLKSVSTVSHPERDRTYNQEPIKTAKAPCSDCGWQAKFVDYRGTIDEQGRTHPQVHSEALAHFSSKPKPVAN
jgi:hypothetical protein